MRTAHDLIEPMVLFAFGASLLFVVVCTRVWPWWRQDVGRAMVSLDLALVLLLAPSALHALTGLNTQDLFFAFYYVTSVAISGVITLWRLVMVVRAQWRRGD